MFCGERLGFLVVLWVQEMGFIVRTYIRGERAPCFFCFVV